jgi:hypothetical protein
MARSWRFAGEAWECLVVAGHSICAGGALIGGAADESKENIDSAAAQPI